MKRQTEMINLVADIDCLPVEVLVSVVHSNFNFLEWYILKFVSKYWHSVVHFSATMRSNGKDEGNGTPKNNSLSQYEKQCFITMSNCRGKRYLTPDYVDMEKLELKVLGGMEKPIQKTTYFELPNMIQIMQEHKISQQCIEWFFQYFFKGANFLKKSKFIPGVLIKDEKSFRYYLIKEHGSLINQTFKHYKKQITKILDDE